MHEYRHNASGENSCTIMTSAHLGAHAEQEAYMQKSQCYSAHQNLCSQAATQAQLHAVYRHTWYINSYMHSPNDVAVAHQA